MEVGNLVVADTAETRSGEVETKTKVFISYSRKDMEFADRLEAALKARGFEPLIDRTEIYALEDWWQRIQALITEADTIIFVLSPEAVTSDICRKEVEFAASLNKRFAPVVCKRVDDNAVPAPLRRYNYIFFDDEAQFEARINLLAEALETDIEWIRKHTEFGALARKWEIAGSPGPNGLLLRSPTLDEAERWIASRPPQGPEPTPGTRAFIVESRRAAKQQKVSALLTITAVTLVVGLGVLGWAKSEDLKLRWDLWRHVLSAKAEQSLKPTDTFKECIDCPEMVVVPAGRFMMGSAEGQGDEGEHPQHTVAIAKPFAVSKYELTFAEWDACTAQGGCAHASDSGGGRGQQPVINIGWDEAKRYVAWLSRITDKPYRLLTEAEYEYAVRAGTTTTYPWGDVIKLNGTAMANCRGCGSQWDSERPAPVGSFSPNKFTLYDMVGNVWEWIEDCSHLSYQGAPTDGSAWTDDYCNFHVLRGGSFVDSPDLLRSARRYGYDSGAQRFDIGFRVARTLDTH